MAQSTVKEILSSIQKYSEDIDQVALLNVTSQQKNGKFYIVIGGNINAAIPLPSAFDQKRTDDLIASLMAVTLPHAQAFVEDRKTAISAALDQLKAALIGTTTGG